MFPSSFERERESISLVFHCFIHFKYIYSTFFFSSPQTKAAYVLVYQRQGLPDPTQMMRIRSNPSSSSSGVAAAAAGAPTSTIGHHPASASNTEASSSNGIDDTDEDEEMEIN